MASAGGRFKATGERGAQLQVHDFEEDAEPAANSLQRTRRRPDSGQRREIRRSAPAEDDDEGEEEEEEEASEDLEQDSDVAEEEDPYNTKTIGHGTGRRRDAGRDQEMEDLEEALARQQQMAYDSMSTILEVDSEASSERGAGHSLPEAHPSAGPSSPSGRRRVGRGASEATAAGSPVGRVSPEDKFGGTLIALAAQMERLQRSAASRGRPSGADSSEDRQKSALGQEQQQQQQQQQQQPKKPSRAASIESLMMINVSPMGSPRGLKLAGAATREPPPEEREERRVVEVSNKSTITAIDLALMDKICEKYFVEMRDKAVQSVKWDDDADLASPLDRRVPQTRSIAVGTEQFSRERFSLLPATKTRSTQTKPNIDDTDIGTSETRRFKLTHLDLGRPVLARRTEPPEERATTPAPPTPTAAEPRATRASPSSDASDSSAPASSISADETPAGKSAELSPSGSGSGSAPEASARDSANSADSLAAAEGAAPESAPVVVANGEPAPGKELQVSRRGPPGESRTGPTPARPAADQRTEERKEPAEEAGPAARAGQQFMQQIPCVKTELRVIIEFADAKQRQRSEVLSNAQLANGRLSKRTEVSTSKQVPVASPSPRQVLDRLQSAGRAHSLMYRQPAGGGQAALPLAPAPSAVAAANESVLRGSGGGGAGGAGGGGHAGAGGAAGEWRELSRSVVRNEIETDTRKGDPKRRGTRVKPNDTVIMSTDASIRRTSQMDDAIDIKSRAVRQFRDAHGQPSERLLVESGAGFDESALRNEWAQQQQQQQQQAAKSPRQANLGQPQQLPPAPPAPPAQPTNGTAQPINSDRERRPLLPPPTPATAAASPTTRRPAAPARHAQQQPPPPPQAKPASQAEPRQERRPSGRPRLPTPESPGASASGRTSRIEIEEELDERHQVTRNGRLVYDDRLREHRYESKVDGAPAAAQQVPPSQQQPQQQPRPPPQQQQQQQQPTVLIPPSPFGSSGLLRSPAGRNLLKPVQLSPSPAAPPPALFSDQTSNLSCSDPETMDSGFAQSGAGGSSSNILQPARNGLPARPLSRASVASPGGGGGGASGRLPQLQQQQQQQRLLAAARERGPQIFSRETKGPELEEADNGSLTFVDDVVDDLINQLDGSRMLAPQRAPPAGEPRNGAPSYLWRGRPAAPKVPDQSVTAAAARGGPRPPSQPAPAGGQGLLSPPAGFRSQAGSAAAPRPAVQSAAGTPHTELTTQLTRSKSKQGSPVVRRTQTRLEQTVAASRSMDSLPLAVGPGAGRGAGAATGREPAGRFRAQVLFESDTDSAAERQSVASSSQSRRPRDATDPRPRATGEARAPRNRKELVTETKYALTAARSSEELAARGGAGHAPSHLAKASHERGRAQFSANGVGGPGPLAPIWDYSLRVNRMRGNKVDSRVNTYISHSRQPLINSEAS